MGQTMSRHRPLGVTIIAVLLIIGGLLELLLGVGLLVGVAAIGRTIAAHGHTTSASVVDVLASILPVISVIIGILTLIFAFGLWFLQRWAFWLAVIIEAISVIRHIIDFTRPGVNVTTTVLGMIIPVVVLLYFLLDRNVREAFFNRG